jgi:hypothetical protein
MSCGERGLLADDTSRALTLPAAPAGTEIMIATAADRNPPHTLRSQM